MSNMFTVKSSNDGMLVTPAFYMSDGGDKRDVGMGVINNMTKDLGINVGDIVNMEVSGKMGAKVETAQADITNANIQQQALSQLSSTMNVFTTNTIQQLNNPNALTSYSLNNSAPSSVGIKIGSDGLDKAVDFNLKVSQLAQPHSLEVGGFTSASTLPAGSITINMGEYTGSGFSPNSNAEQLTVNVTNGMTLEDLAQEISKQSSSIDAQVVNDGKGGTKLALMSTETGVESAMQITTTGGLGMFDFNGTDTATTSEAQKAQDSIYSVNGIEMSSPTNNVSYLGIDMTLTKASNEIIKISSESNPDAIVENVNAFVQNYNALVTMLNSFNESTPSKDYVGSIHDTDTSEKIEQELEDLWSGISDAGISMSELGVALYPDGTLKLSEDILRKNLDDNPNLARDMLGSSANSSADWMTITKNGDTVDGSHEIIIDSAPKKASYSTAPLANPVTIPTDTTIKMDIGGKKVDVLIEAGDYSPNQLAAKFSSQFMSAGVSGYSATVSSGGELVFESDDYGSTESISFDGDTPLLGITGGKYSGDDVKGYVNGQRVLGSGTSLTSKFDKSTEGLEIEVDPDNLVLNSKEKITTSTGALTRIENSMEALIDPIDGIVTKEVNQLTADLSDTGKDSLIIELNKLEEKREMWYEYYTNVYSSLSSTLSALDNTSSYLDSMFGPDSDS